jgi:allantoin racemase
MKIWYQSMTAVGGAGAYTEELRRQVDAATPEDCEITIAGIPRVQEHADHQFRFWEMVDERDVVSNAIRAQEEGCSAFLIGNIADPGLHASREVTDLPVIGLGDVSFFLARQMGQRLGLVAITELQAFRMEEKVHALGLDRQLVAIERMDLDRYADLHAGYQEQSEDPDKPVLDAFNRCASDLVRQGADVVLPFGGVVMGLLSRFGITRVDNVPIVNGVPTLAALGASLGSTYASQGHFTSKRLAYAAPPPPALAEIRRRFGGQLGDGPLGVPEGTVD